jgi:hypothetical protein
MSKIKNILFISFSCALFLSACGFSNQNVVKDEKNENNVDKLENEYVIDRLNLLSYLGELKIDDNSEVFVFSRTLNKVDARVYIHDELPKEVIDFKTTNLEDDFIEHYNLQKRVSVTSQDWVTDQYNFKSFYEINNGPVFEFSGKGDGDLSEELEEIIKKELRFLANIFYLTLKYPDFIISNSAYSYNGQDFYFFDFSGQIFSEVIMNCSFDSDCILNRDYYRIISIAKSNKQDKINEIISKFKNFNYDIDPTKREEYNEHISRLQPICQNNICSLDLITDESDEYYLLNLYNNVFKETIVKNISFDKLQGRYNLFVWFNSKDEYIKTRIYHENNADLGGYEIKNLDNNIIEYSHFNEEVEILSECLESEHGLCMEREYYHYNFSVYYELANGFLFEFIGDGHGSLNDLNKNKILDELRFIINLLELPLKYKDFKYTDLAISYNGKDYYFIDFYRREISNLIMSCQTDNDCLVSPYYCDTIPYIPLSTKNNSSKLKNLKQKVEYFNKNFTGKCVDVSDNYFTSQCLNNVCVLIRGENQTSNTQQYLNLKKVKIKQE